ncbi:MAG: hypothetical protein AB7S38_11205 [Vulcanimicrobiota bacterium]
MRPFELFRSEEVVLPLAAGHVVATLREPTAMELREFLQLRGRYRDALTAGREELARRQLVAFILRASPDARQLAAELDLDQTTQLFDLQDQLNGLAELFQTYQRGKVSKSRRPRHADHEEAAWLEMAALVSATYHGPDPGTLLTAWPARLLVRYFKMAQRDRWHHQTFLAALQGVKPGTEPIWELDEFVEVDEDEWNAFKTAYRARNLTPEGIKFPGTL